MLELIQISSLENILPKLEQQFTQINKMSVIKGEKASYQLAFCMDNDSEYNIEFESDIQIKAYKIGCVPVMRTVFNREALEDDNYISKESGMYPDVLFPLDGNTVNGEYYYQGIWIEIDTSNLQGEYSITAKMYNDKESVSVSMQIEVLDFELSEPKMKYCVAVHTDCIASHYNMEVFSQENWEMIEKFISLSAEYGSNMLVPPVFTPPVDTKPGHERLTVQLVDIYKSNDKYTFDFSKFGRYIDICHKAGIKYFYMPHFFTQWGAEFAPKFEVVENGEKKKMFGWDVKSTDESYMDFLRQFIPALSEYIQKSGIKDEVFFGISDEPFGDDAIKRYSKLSEFLKPYLKDYKTIDAMTDFGHYKTSGVDYPLIPTNCINEFKDKINDMYIYYCCAQDYKVSNRFIAMPSYRNRSFGYQLYKYKVSGFFHWALNFYNSRLSVRAINPFYETDADGGFPAGDAYCVYPGEDGPVKSIRLVVFNEALQDLRLLELLENFIGYDNVVKLVESVTGEIDFENCARCADTILKIRENIINELKSIKIRTASH